MLAERAIVPAREQIRTEKEFIKPSSTNLILIGMQGEGGFSLHDPVAVGVIAKRVKTDNPTANVLQIDTQPELQKTGKLNTDALAKRLYDEVMKDDKKGKATVVGFSMPIFSLNYTQTTIEKYKQLCEDDGNPQGRVEMVIGGSIPSHTDTALLKTIFPNVSFVKGQGEERMSAMIAQVQQGEELTESKNFEYADLSKYVGADRALTRETMMLGGKPKAEFSRGCGFGNCFFCSRDVLFGRNGLDFNNVPVERAVHEVKDINSLFLELAESVSGEGKSVLKPQFELTDEDAFSDIEHTKLLISALKSAQDDNSLPRIPFTASVRVNTINKLEAEKDTTGEISLLDQLMEVGLEQVFIGIESGNQSSLNGQGKGQRMNDCNKAIKTVLDKEYIEPSSKTKKPLKLEIGFITFDYNMTMDMLKENVAFLAQTAGDENGAPAQHIKESNAHYVSSLFNSLEVRAGSKDEDRIKKIAEKVKVDKVKYSQFNEYNPTENFNINTSAYENVPFMDEAVANTFAAVNKFSQEENALYYTLKSVNRAGSLKEDDFKKTQAFALAMKSIQLDFLRSLVGLTPEHDHQENRRNLVEQMHQVFGKEMKGDGLDSLRREIGVFLQEEEERAFASQVQHGATLILRDTKNRILLVRPRGQNEWAFPGGNLKISEGKLEDPLMAGLREAKEELGLPDDTFFNIEGTLPSIKSTNHKDKTTGVRELELHHFLGTIHAGIVIDLAKADHEIADTLRLSPEDIISGKVKTKANVMEIAKFLEKKRDRSHRPEETTVFTIS